MLYLIGMGLEEGDMSQKALETIKRCSKVFTEVYTSFPYRIFGEPIGREKVESEFLLKIAEREDVALVVPGDPLFATTHIALYIEARKRGIGVEVIHAPSIINAISRTGLSPYKFGRIITIGEKLFESDRERIEKNLEAGLHTLVLIDPEVDPLEALQNLLDFGEILVCSRLGTSGEKVWRCGGKLPEKVDKPACAVVMAELAHFEREFVEAITEDCTS